MAAFAFPADMTPPPGAHLDAEGVWCQVLAPEGSVRRGAPALFLDRDGVLVDEVRFLHRVEDMRIAKGAVATVRAANALGVPVIVVTNQAGIGRGFYGWAEFATVQAAILAALAAEGALIDAVYACPFVADGVAPYGHPDHPARKPNPGMVTRGLDAFPVDVKNSWIVGDRAGDVGAGLNAGLCGAVHLACGHGVEPGQRADSLALATDGFSVIGCDDLAEALPRIPILLSV